MSGRSVIRTMPRVAIVTGGASGIGRALGAALVRRGDEVVLADLDGPAATAAADRLAATGPGSATAAAVDVRDPAAVADLVSQTARRYGRLDLMVNNAGIGMGGNVEELTVAHWRRVIDVNLLGVVNGVQAAYPLMVRQGHGHIVNTASVGGLLPMPTGAPYATTKWAVVGLSLSLRAEASDKGVQVSVVCPGGVDTPLLDQRPPADLPPVPSAEARDVRAEITRASGGRLLSPDALAEEVLRGIDRNRALIVVPRQARVLWRLMRLSPPLLTRLFATMATRTGRAGATGTAPQSPPAETTSSPAGLPHTGDLQSTSSP
ncbi:SDR family NAD(P)-dependent oxidoreductase [Geodermatophilus sp. SYSU D00691]